MITVTVPVANGNAKVNATNGTGSICSYGSANKFGCTLANAWGKVFLANPNPNNQPDADATPATSIANPGWRINSIPGASCSISPANTQNWLVIWVKYSDNSYEHCTTFFHGLKSNQTDCG